ncbi:unnamed protein product [Candida verbasci]|uniref:Mitochondrial distribution and morphology protein 32 n=1 Tax=Candida verbasci TaxID=1227364 RepID=A0A9W4TRD1_9ASCO|nr:unnamed protein product [Candida verbasci]
MSLIKLSNSIINHQLPRVVTPVSILSSSLVYKQFSKFHTTTNLKFKPTRYSYGKITKSVLLSQANNKLSRFFIHLKWPFIRNSKLSPLELISPFISSFILGNLIWIILGTTTFMLSLIYFIYYFDSLFSHESKILGPLTNNILSYGLGLNLKFETNNYLPEFKDGKIRFKNLIVTNKENEDFIFKGKIEALEMTLSFNKWYEGNGLIYNLEVYGLHGELTRETITSKNSFIDKNYLFDHVKIFDSVIEINDENVTLNIFNCDLPKLRGDKILVDIFNANNISGAINNSMFTIHKRQNFNDDNKVIRFKLDSIDLANFNTKSFNWLVQGKAEIIADIKLPKEENLITESMGEIIKNNLFYKHKVEQEDESLLKDAVNAIYYTFKKEKQQMKPTMAYAIINFKIKLKDLKASLPKNLPLSQNNQPFISLTDLRSLIQFINQNENQLIVKSQVIEKLTDLYNIESLSNLKIFDSLIYDIYEEFKLLVKDDEKRIYNEKSWAQSIATQLLVIGLGAMV